MNYFLKLSTISLVNYTLTLLIKGSLDDSGRKALLESITSQFDSVEEDLWGSKNLAYPINKSDKAYYAHYQLVGDPKKIPAIDKKLRLNEDIIRYLLLKK